MIKKIPIILDGDPGHDDAIAWVMAFAQEALDVRGVVTVAGNAPLKKTTRNMLQTMTLIKDSLTAIGKADVVDNIPLAEGCAFSLVGEVFEIPVEVHGESGLDGPVLPEPTVSLSELSGVELMAKLLRESDEPITLVPTGPLTNIASLILAHPELKPKIAHISLMGGGMLMGNWTPAAEFNILVDPEAAKVVFESGIPITMAGLDVTEKAYVTPKDFERVRALGGKLAEVVADWLEFFYQFHQKFGYAGAPVHDPVAVVALINPSILEIHDVYVQVETSGEYCRGATIGDFLGSAKQKPNARVIMNIDREAFVDMIVDSMRFYRGAV